jgi:hypothetical protein
LSFPINKEGGKREEGDAPHEQRKAVVEEA